MKHVFITYSCLNVLAIFWYGRCIGNGFMQNVKIKSKECEYELYIAYVGIHII